MRFCLRMVRTPWTRLSHRGNLLASSLLPENKRLPIRILIFILAVANGHHYLSDCFFFFRLFIQQ
jgi:hypothetical protein